MRQEALGSGRDVVSALREGLAERIGHDRFNLWFSAQIQFTIAANTVLVTAPNTFLLDRIRRQFAPDIQIAVDAICGPPTRAEFQVREVVGSPPAADLAAPLPAAPAKSSAIEPSGLQSVSAPAGATRRRRLATLSSFCVGTGNRVAFTSAESIVKRPGVVSPLFLYGPPGSGKSHLLEAICAAVRDQSRTVRALLLSAEQYTCHFLEALQGSGLPNFRRKCRDVDLLAIDDIQFFANKKATLVEFQHTLDALARQGHQLVLTADRAPAELSILGSEIITRLTGGLVCGIECADYETRLAITRQFVQRDQLQVPDEVMRLIAEETSGDARQVRGALNRLRATGEALDQPITIDLARGTLPDIFASAQRMVRLPDVERAVCEVFGIESKALRDGNKTKAVSQPRMLAMWLARKYTRAAFSEIGAYFGRRSHSTVISAQRKVNSWVAHGAKLQLGRTDWQVDDAIRRIETKLRTG
jgi:chromosomal replication initiator protein